MKPSKCALRASANALQHDDDARDDRRWMCRSSQRWNSDALKRSAHALCSVIESLHANMLSAFIRCVDVRARRFDVCRMASSAARNRAPKRSIFFFAFEPRICPCLMQIGSNSGFDT